MRSKPFRSGKSRTSKSAIPVSAALILMIGSVLISSCSAATNPTPSVSPTTAPATYTALPPSSTPIPTATVVSLLPPYSVWDDPSLPVYFKESLSKSDQIVFSDPGSSQLTISLDGTLKAGSWTYLAVAPFYSLLESVSSDDLYACWSAGWESASPFKHIHISPEIQESVELFWGPSSGDCIIITDNLEITQALWVETDSIAIIPFESIEPSLKVLAVDGIVPFDREANLDDYALGFHLYLNLPPGIHLSQDNYAAFTNFDPEYLSVVALTGVTALVRDTANIMESQGVLYPATDIQDLLIGADITHISNEIPFAVDCPTPDASQVSLRFCSDDNYLQLLEAVGTDIVELSGDHFGDWGPEAMLHTIELYENKGWAVYGGGRNLQDGLAPTYLSHNSNQFAFIGCNGKGIAIYATATDDNPGASQCDFDWMIPEISRLTNAGYIVIATMQHEEVDSFWPIALQQYDFRRLAEAGAVIVSGSQAHHPQGFEFLGDSFIHYGLGNLFFDQYFLSQYNPKLHMNKDKAFIDLHYFYQGQHIGTRLVALQFIDNARPRPMTPEEKYVFFESIFQSSRWNDNWISTYSSGIISTRMDE